MKNRRQVAIVIVEGPSDQMALSSILSEELLGISNVRFLIVHGDITTDKDADQSNILSRVWAIVKKELSLYSLKPRDVKEVIQIVDTDGTYIDDGLVVYDEKHRKPFYETDRIRTSNVDGIKSRNARKRGNLSRLTKCYNLNKDIPYSIYFMSCNLDHVLFDKMNASDAEKKADSDAFALQYGDNAEKIPELLSNSEIFLDKEYKDSWQFIQEGSNSLKRYSNIAILFARIIEEKEKAYLDG